MQSSLETAAAVFGGFQLHQLFEQLVRRPARLGGVRQKVVQTGGHGAQADALQFGREIM